MPPRQVAYLPDIFHSVKVIRQYAAGLTHQQSPRTPRRRTPSFGAFSSPVKPPPRLTPETYAFPRIPFHKIAGLRNRVVHDVRQG